MIKSVSWLLWWYSLLQCRHLQLLRRKQTKQKTVLSKLRIEQSKLRTEQAKLRSHLWWKLIKYAFIYFHNLLQHVCSWFCALQLPILICYAHASVLRSSNWRQRISRRWIRPCRLLLWKRSQWTWTSPLFSRMLWSSMPRCVHRHRSHYYMEVTAI